MRVAPYVSTKGNEMFKNIKDQLDNPITSQILRLCVYPSTIEAADKKLTEYKINKNRNLYGWLENDTIIGICGYEVHQTSHVEILHIAVDETARGRGIGGAMVRALQAQCNLPIKAETDDDAIEFYRKLGFKATEFQKYGVRRWDCTLSVKTEENK